LARAHTHTHNTVSLFLFLWLNQFFVKSLISLKGYLEQLRFTKDSMAAVERKSFSFIISRAFKTGEKKFIDVARKERDLMARGTFFRAGRISCKLLTDV